VLLLLLLLRSWCAGTRAAAAAATAGSPRSCVIQHLAQDGSIKLGELCKQPVLF